MCLLFAKSGVELLMLTIAGDNQFWRWQAWFLLLSLGVCALLQLWYMHKSLVLADPTVVCPLAFCFYNLSSIFNGLVYFDQFSLLSKTQLILVLLGISILLAGVWIVSFPPAGGYSIDIGAWASDDTHSVVSADEHDSELGDEDEGEEVQEDEPLPMHARRRSRTMTLPAQSRPISDDIGMGPVSPIEQPFITRPPSPVAPPRLSSPSSPSARRATTAGHAEPGLGTESLRRSRSSYADSPTASPSARRRRTTLGAGSVPLSPPPPFGGALAPSASALGGFSIGLSPVSPGFALVPTERRRRGGRRESAVLGRGVDEEEQGERERDMRRVVSEGDRDAYEREEEREGLLSGRNEVQTHNRRAKGRWKWLRDVFVATSGSK